MKEFLNPDSIYAATKMQFPPPKAILLLEGSDEDAILIDHLETGVVRIICGGKRTVLGAAQIAEEEGDTHVFGLVDRDLDDFSETSANYPSNVVATEAYDLIADVLMSEGDAIRRILFGHGSEAARTVEAVGGRRADDIVYDMSLSLAAVRLAVVRNSLPLVLRDYDFLPVFDRRFRVGSLGEFAKNARLRDPLFSIDSAVIGFVEAAQLETRDYRRVCGGHDLVGAMFAVLSRGGATNVAKKALAANVKSLASCRVLASLACLRRLDAIVRARVGARLFACADWPVDSFA